MNKARNSAVKGNRDGMRAEYDFSGGVRGKHYRAMEAGYTIEIRKADGTMLVKEVKPKEGAILLDADVRRYFPDSPSVNAALRSLIRLIPAKRPQRARKAARAGGRTQPLGRSK